MYTKIVRETNGDEMERKAYRKPELTQYNDLRTLTLGSSPGGTESSDLGIIDRKVIGGAAPARNASSGESTTDIFEG